MVAAGAATGCPLSATAQQPVLPIIGFIDSRSSDGMASRLAGFHQGLQEAGFVDGQNATIVYRWADNRTDRLPDMAAELVRQRPAVIFATGGPTSALATKASTSTIPTVFLVGEDPTRIGLVGSLARPGGNLTGVNLFVNEIEAKRLDLLLQFVPLATRVAVLVNPSDVRNTENTIQQLSAPARARGLQIQVVETRTAREIDDAFAAFAQQRPDALFIGAAAFLNARRVQLAQLAAFHRLPAAYGFRESVEAGGLMSYGSSIEDAYRQCGIYVGRILKGANPSDMPVTQASKFQLAVNVRTARLLGLAVPQAILATADEVIE
jgi:putative ABC transport system substrate-binding protein